MTWQREEKIRPLGGLGAELVGCILRRKTQLGKDGSMCPTLGRRETGASRAAQWLAVSGAVLFSCDGNMKD